MPHRACGSYTATTSTCFAAGLPEVSAYAQSIIYIDNWACDLNMTDNVVDDCNATRQGESVVVLAQCVGVCAGGTVRPCCARVSRECCWCCCWCRCCCFAKWFGFSTTTVCYGYHHHHTPPWASSYFFQGKGAEGPVHDNAIVNLAVRNGGNLSNHSVICNCSGVVVAESVRACVRVRVERAQVCVSERA
jgi:hypothetical protein